MKAKINYCRCLMLLLPIFLAMAGHASSAVTEGQQKWSFSTTQAIVSSPAIGADGTVYFGCNDGYLYAVNPDGTEKWARATGNDVQSSPAIGTDGTIYIGSRDNYLYSIDPQDGSINWTFKTGGAIDATPAIARGGAIYVGSYDGYLYAVNPDGNELWSTPTTGIIHCSPAIGADGTIYYTTNVGHLYAVNPTTGNQKWDFNGGYAAGESSPAIDVDGTIYVGLRYLYAVTPSGGEKWHFPNDGFMYSPVIGPDGTVYVSSSSGQVSALNPASGSKRWSFQTNGSGNSAPAVGLDGVIYVGSLDGYLRALNPDGSLRWKFQLLNTSSTYQTSPAIARGGTVYTAAGSVLKAVAASSNGLPHSPWPMFGRDTAHTGAYLVQSQTPDFDADQTHGSIPFKVNFTNLSTGYYQGVTWDFGDGKQSIVENPAHTYTQAGAYTVKLTISGPYSADITETKTDYITVTPPAGSITGTIAPKTAITAGAQWNVDGLAWNNSGATVSDLGVGIHTVAFKPIADWDAPGGVTVNVQNKKTVNVKGTYSAKGAVQLASPAGGESWSLGDTAVVSWTYQGNPGKGFKIELLKAGAPVGTIAAKAPIGSKGKGSYKWKVPYTTAAGSDYQIRITSITAGKEYCTATSAGNFELYAPAIQVLSPNGGESWPLKSKQFITWTYTGNPGPKLKIELLSGGAPVRVISAAAPSAKETFTWKIPASVADGDNYRVRITSKSMASCTGSSAADFSITSTATK